MDLPLAASSAPLGLALGCRCFVQAAIVTGAIVGILRLRWRERYREGRFIPYWGAMKLHQIDLTILGYVYVEWLAIYEPLGRFHYQIVVCRLMRIRVFSRLIIATWHYQTVAIKEIDSIGWTA